MVGILLVLAVDASMVLGGFRAAMQSAYGRVAVIFLIYGVCVMVPVGIVYGHDPARMARDVVPFLFLFLPLFIQVRTKRERDIVTASILAVGVLFALRLVGPFNAAGGDPLYLSIAPTVLFAALFFAGMAGMVLYRRVGVAALVKSAIALGVSVLCLAAMAMTMQRASLGLFVLGVLVLAEMAVVRAPIRAVAPVGILSIVIFATVPLWGPVAEALVFKQGMVGMNMRWQEAEAVFKVVQEAGFFAALFGMGWGAMIESPAVGEIAVGFTHNLFTTLLLKGGWVAVGLMAVMLYRLCWPGVAALKTAPVVMVALFAPIAIDSVLYASFKSLDFGLILLLMRLWTRPVGPADGFVDKSADSAVDGRNAAPGVLLRP
jgi:hypothetical protein